MTIRRITDVERKMFVQGYASTGIVARKTKMHRTTVARLFKAGDFKGKRIAKQFFIAISSVREYMGTDAIEMFNLNDWSDVVPEETSETNKNLKVAPRKRRKQ